MAKVVWSPYAVETYDDIISYLLEKFGEAAVEKFVRHVDVKIKLIANSPAMFRSSGKKPNTYITNILKKAKLTYRYNHFTDQVDLIIFWGMQDPEKKPQ